MPSLATIMSWRFWSRQIQSLPATICWVVLKMIGLAVEPSQIVRVVPDHPAMLRVRGSLERNDEGSAEVSVTEWVWSNVPSLHGLLTPSWWLPNGHLQTVYSVLGNFSNVDRVDYKRTYLRVPDGGTLALDFAPLDHNSLPSSTPIMVVCHGLTGGSHESYVRNVLAWATSHGEGGLGVRAVVVNFRGCAGTPVTSPQLYSAGTTIDLATSLHYLRHSYPHAPLHGIGFSLGASVLSRYLGESGNTSLLSSGIVLGCPWSLPEMSHMLESNWFRRFAYSNAMAQNLLRLFFSHYEKHPDIFDSRLHDSIPVLEQLRRRRRVRLKDVDDHMVAKIGGPQGPGMWPFKDADEYYEWARADRWITRVRRPLLAINAFDDPIVNGASLPISEYTHSTHVIGAVSGSGGHLGWFDGPAGAKTRWILQPIKEYWSAAVRDLSINGPAVTTTSGSSPISRASTPLDLSKASRAVKETALSGEDWTLLQHGEGWQWVAETQGSVGPVGWKVLDAGEVVEGGEDSGVIQGL